jgi:hypothetical protein
MGNGVYHRFLEVLHWHSLDPAQAAAVLHRFGFTHSIIDDARSSLDRLTDEAVAFVCDHFRVDRDWLMTGRGYCNGNQRMWSGSGPQFVREMLERQARKKQVCVHFVKHAEADLEEEASWTDRSLRFEVGLVVEERHRLAGNRTYSTYERWGFEPWGYDRTREELMAIAWFFAQQPYDAPRIDISGARLKPEVFDPVYNSEMHIAEAMKDQHRKFPDWWPLDAINDTLLEQVRVKVRERGIGEVLQQQGWKEHWPRDKL